MSNDITYHHQTASQAGNSQSASVDLPQSESISLPLDQKHRVEDLAKNHAPVAETLGTATAHKNVVTTKAREIADYMIELGGALRSLLKQVEDAKVQGDPRLDGIPAGAAFYYICSRELGLSPKNAKAAMVASVKSLETLDPYSSAKLRAPAEKKRAQSKNAYLEKKVSQLAVVPSSMSLPLAVVPPADVELLSPPVTASGATPTVVIPTLSPIQPVKPSKLAALLAPLFDPEFEQRRADNTLTKADLELVAKAAGLGLFYAQEAAAGKRLKPTGYVPKKQPANPSAQQSTLDI